jgi:hypothetical protein
VADIVGHAFGSLHMTHQGLRRRKEVAAGTGKRHPTGGAIKEAESEVRFQFGHQLADGLGRQAEPVGCCRKAVQFGHCQKRLDLAQGESGEGHAFDYQSSVDKRQKFIAGSGRRFFRDYGPSSQADAKLSTTTHCTHR